MKTASLDTLEAIPLSHNPRIPKQVMIANGEIDRITNFSRAVFPPGETVNAHAHKDMTEVFFVLSGRGKILVDDVKIDLSPGVCITVEPNETHALANTSTEDLVLLYFGVAE